MSTNGPFASDDTDATAIADLFSQLFSEAGLDSVWLDLDGDDIPDVQVSAYDAGATADGGSDPFEVTEDGPDIEDESSFDTETDTTDFDTSEYDDWVSIPTEEGGSPIYDVAELIPEQSTPYADWTDPAAHGYDPFSMSNFSVDGGPVIYDQASGDPYCATDYTSTALWYNVAPFDDGAGYWDPTYAVMPAHPDMSMWQSAPDSYAPDAYVDPYAMSMYSDPSTMYTDSSSSYADFTYPDYSTTYSVPGYDSTDFTSWSSSSATDPVTSYFTDYTFDDQLEAASTESQYWTTEYNDASSLANDYWQMSVDASTAGDSSLAYDYNQLSLDATSYANDAWSYSSDAWSSVSSSDDGWYDAMSLD